VVRGEKAVSISRRLGLKTGLELLNLLPKLYKVTRAC
jgi:hypothetical protein